MINKSCPSILKKARQKDAFTKYLSTGTDSSPPPFAGSLANKPVESKAVDRHIKAHQIVAKNKTIYVRDDENVSKLSDGRMAVGVGSHDISRGLHVSGVTHVILFGDAPSASEFVHCAGRTGRMQQEGEVISIFPPSSGKALQEVCYSLELPFKLTKESAVDALLMMDDYFEAEATTEKETQSRQKEALKRRVSSENANLAIDLDEQEEVQQVPKMSQAELEKIVEGQYEDISITMDPYTRAAQLEAMLFPEL